MVDSVDPCRTVTVESVVTEVEVTASSVDVEVHAPAIEVLVVSDPISVEIVSESVVAEVSYESVEVEVTAAGGIGPAGPPGVGIPEVFLDGDPATLNFAPLGDGTYKMVVSTDG